MLSISITSEDLAQIVVAHCIENLRSSDLVKLVLVDVICGRLALAEFVSHNNVALLPEVWRVLHDDLSMYLINPLLLVAGKCAHHRVFLNRAPLENADLQ